MVLLPDKSSLLPVFRIRIRWIRNKLSCRIRIRRNIQILTILSNIQRKSTIFINLTNQYISGKFLQHIYFFQWLQNSNRGHHHPSPVSLLLTQNKRFSLIRYRLHWLRFQQQSSKTINYGHWKNETEVEISNIMTMTITELFS